MITDEIIAQYEPTIGIECHVQLKTATKLFSGASNDARGAAPNTMVSPICFGLPGTLPVLNEHAVKLALRAGIALNAEIALVSFFERKHYFYPDLPKGYQITQLEQPIVGKGYVDVPLKSGELFRVRINRAHMEEDAGKLTHPAGSDYSLVDLNRAGTPLIEIVSEADMHSPQQAKAYVQELYLLMKQAEVTHGDLYHGNMRFDINVSVAKKGADAWGTRTETKNLNSFRSVEKATEYEIRRQIEVLEKGGQIVQETRGWDDAKQRTFSQRSKEDAMDYRYFPDADIPPLVVTEQEIEAARRDVEPLLPATIRQRLTVKGIPAKDIETLFTYPVLLNRILMLADHAEARELKQACDLLINVLPAEFEKAPELANDETILSDPHQIIKLIELVNDAKISSSSAKLIVAAHFSNLTDPVHLAADMNLLQETDTATIETVVVEVMQDPASQKAIDDINSGNDKAIGYLVGQVMKRSQGKANPSMATVFIRKYLKG